MKRILTSFCILCATYCLSMAQSFTAPTVDFLEKGIPAEGEMFYMYNVEKEMFFTKGTTWGTHAALTDKVDDALMYELQSVGSSYQLYCASLDKYLFNSSETGAPYVDWASRYNVSARYFELKSTTSGYFRIVMGEDNYYYWWLPEFALGWSKNNVDIDNNGNPLGTNVSLYFLSTEEIGNRAFEWAYCKDVEKVKHYGARKALYDAMLLAEDYGFSISSALAIYNNESSTTTQISNAAAALQKSINNSALINATESNPANVTSYITNPNFAGNANGWEVDMPHAQNKGYQGASYTNGSIRIAQFAEAWVPQGGTLGAGQISQTISGLPDGKYILEADLIASNQASASDPVHGVMLFGESQVLYTSEVTTVSGTPEHFSMELLKEGETLTIGIRTAEDNDANWFAFDNVQLYYLGNVTANTTSVSVSPTSFTLVGGETKQLTAKVTTNDPIFNRVIWSSSDENVATVSTTGVVTAQHSGTAFITATGIKSTKSATARVSVTVNRPTGLVINEIQVANNDMYIDPSFNYGSWIELYNTTNSTISLAGLYVSDGTNEFRLTTDHGVIPAKGYALLWFDHNAADGNYSNEAHKQVNFKLEYEGGTISILDGDKNEVTTVTYPQATPRCSYARTTNGGDTWGTTSSPTPEENNAYTNYATERLAAPVVDTDSRLFEDPFTVQVEIPEGTTLYYTSDGSTPSPEYSDESDGTFYIDETTILRFCLAADGYLNSPVVTRSYIYRNHDYYLPVISISTNPDNLFDSTIGLYTKGSNGTTGNGRNDACNWNRDWERPVNVEYLVPEENSTDYSMVLNQEVDFEISGGWTRAYGANMVDGKYWEMTSSFRLKTDKRYEGVNELAYPVFPDKPYNKYKVWQVRNGGNDTKARIIDPALQQMVMKSGIDIDCQDYQPAHVFFNGMYLGMLNIRESNNKHFGYSNRGIDTKDMDQFDLSNARYNQKAGDEEAWLTLVALSEQLASDHSEETYAKVCELLDIDEFINYMACDCYIGPSDWITNTNNVKGYRSKSDGGKFRFVLFDTDSAWDNNNMVANILNTNYGANVDDLFRNLMQYPPLRRQFIDAYCLVDGSIFEPERCTDIIYDIYNNISPALAFENLRTNTNMAGTIQNAHNGVRVTNMQSALGVSNPYRVSLASNIDEAHLLVNGQEVPTGKFSGMLYDYNKQGIYLTAKAPAGYVFKGWECQSNNTSTVKNTIIGKQSTWDYYDQGSMDSRNWTATSFRPSSYNWASGKAPFGFASNSTKPFAINSNTTLDYGTNASNKRPSYYFRKTFTLASAPTDNDLYLFNYEADDGLMVYVNGTAIGNYYVNDEAYSSYTTGGHYEGDNAATGTFTIPNELLKKGSNVVAVLVKNCSANSSDIYFEGELVVATANTESNVISTDETFCLSKDNTPATYDLTATFEAIENERARWEAGATPVRINEVSAGNDMHINEYNKKADWIELYNTTDHDIDLKGMYLSDNAKKPQKFQFTEGTIPAHGTKVVWCDQKENMGELHASFKLDNADGAFIGIQAEDGRWADRINYMAQARWQTYGRYPDGGNHESILTIPTIEKSNKLGTYDFASNITPWETSDITITLSMVPGWNWTSHNLAEEVNRTRFTTYANCIRGQQSEIKNAGAEGWQGTLTALDAALGYKVQMNQEADITLRGNLYDTTVPVTLQAGWNWIGFPVYNATTITAAMADYTPTEGDLLVAQDAFAEYYSGEWMGTLSSLQPGQAYLLYSQRAQQFCWTSLSKVSAKKRYYASARATAESPWELDIHAYPNVMTMVAKLETENIDLSNQYYVGAFCGDECRGVASIDENLLYMNIHGNETEGITFRLLDGEGTTYQARQTLAMQPQYMAGSHKAPYTLSFNTNNIEDIIATPNSTASTVVAVNYYNMAGQRVTNPTHGVFIQKTLHQNGKVTFKKVSR